ncbi:MAG: phenylalanine--tRNA ligase subunit beta [Firmicutes bacterium]|nr:phenylalanine--tRNA ligase subunit beta [Bacillota bacterium]
MKLSREWLGEYTTIGAPDKEYCDAMTLSGSKVEGWEVTGSEISRVVVGRVISMERHTNSDHMWVCKIDVGGERELQIVTGAQNVNIGDLVPVALDGSTLPGGKEIRTGKLRGELSEGMLCSLGELGLEQRDFPYAIEDGIFILEEDCVPGDDIREVCGLNDSVVEFEITNNRPDCLSVRGLARESACTFHTPLTFAEPTVTAGHGDIHEKLSVEIKDAELCPRYTARMVKNIKIAPSPKWMRRRLRASGVRPINNIVDITNYVMLEYGQPMHAFDYACLHDGKIIVRRAEEGESLRTLDGNDHALTPGMLVIADPEGPVALAGVMGGANSEITDETTTIVFESANFLGHSIRKTAIALGMRTDASGRFEKGLDLFATVPAVDRACELVEMLGAGEVFDGTIDVLAKEPETTFIELDDKRINALLGTDIPREFMADTLTSLGFELNGNTLTVPSWRGDCTMLADIAEECARFWGYNKIEATDIRGAATQGGYSEKTLFVRKLGTACRAMGYTEVMTYSFVSPSSLDKIKVPADSPLRDNYRILNPLGEDTSVMRTTALPSMLGVLSTNLNRRNMEAKLYEMATVYKKQPGKMLADERTVLTLGAYGGDVDFFALKGAVEALLCAARTPDVRFTADTETAAFHPGRCAAVWSGDTRLGTLGQIHPDVCAAYGLDGATYCAEIDVVLLHDLEGAEPVYTPLPRFPAITRDIAVVCDAAVPVGELTECICKAEKNVLRGVKLFDVYTGVGIPEGKKSIAFSLTLRSDDGTLTDDHAEEAVRAVLDALRENFGAVIR